MSSDNGWPMPPAPPNTVTFDAYSAHLVTSAGIRVEGFRNGGRKSCWFMYLFGRGGEGSPLAGIEDVS